MSELIGLRFKRNKYGLSLWEDHIQEIIYKREYSDSDMRSIVPGKGNHSTYFNLLKNRKKLGCTLIPMVIGKNTLGAYKLDEIIVYYD